MELLELPMVSATLFFALVPVAHLAGIHLYRRRQNQVPLLFASTLGVFVVSLGIALYAYSWPMTKIGPFCAWFGFWSLGYMEFFSMLCRGFSLTILSDLQGSSPKSLEEILDQYGSGQGGRWLFRKRLEGLLRSGMVVDAEGKIRLHSDVGRCLSAATARYKGLLKLGKGG